MFAGINPLAKHFKLKPVQIYDTIFTLHCKCTVVILIICTVLLSMKQYFGDPIVCLSDEKEKDFINSLCWTMGTYIVDYNGIRTKSGRQRNSSAYRKMYNIAEGVGQEVKGRTKRIYLRYYQWVVLFMLLQAFVFYLPMFLWKLWEKRRLKQLCADVEGALVTESVYKERLKMLIKYFSSNYRDEHCCYLVKYTFCELLNVVISFANIFLLDVFLNGFWFKYIAAMAAVSTYDWRSWNHMSSRVFPKVAKCDMFKFGYSGSIVNRDILCLLPLNILNEKIFAFLWCWFLLMTLLATVKLIYRCIVLFSSNCRLQLLRTQLRCMPKAHIRIVLQHITTADWFLLYKVSRNINTILFRDLVQELYTLYVRNNVKKCKNVA